MLDALFARLPDLIANYGYLLVAVVIGLESMGLPLPGETTLIAASLYAGSTQSMSITLIILSGIAGAVIGDNIGYWIGRELGFPLLVRHGGRVGLGPDRLKLGQYLFLRHGGKVVFFGRFVALLRTLAALLAGANHMDWRRFVVWNAAGGIIWVTGYSLGAYLLGSQIDHLLGPIGIIFTALAVTALAFGVRWIHRGEARLQAAAELAFPGPLLHPKDRAR